MTIRKPAGTDPRRAGGSIAGPGGPHERSGVVIDTTNAILLDSCVVAMVERSDKNGTPTKQQPPIWCMNLGGRINKTRETASINYLFDVDGAAAIITELFGLASRQGADAYDALMEAVSTRMEALDESGHL